jgi:hypothetical protein
MNDGLNGLHPAVACCAMVCTSLLFGWGVYWFFRFVRDVD